MGVAAPCTSTRRTGSTPITEACEEGGASCFTTGIDPGFANDLFPMTLMGLCSEVRKVRASELLDYTNYEGDYENEMGIGRRRNSRPLLENPDMLIFAWGATVSDDRARGRASCSTRSPPPGRSG